MHKFLRATMLATSLVVAGGAYMTPAFAEVVYNRGNAGDPESLDPHKTSTVYEAHILRDLFEGLVIQDAKAEVIPGVAESWTSVRRRQRLHLQAARRWRTGRTASR